MTFNGGDYKLLETFVAVVEAKGISNAQNRLGKDSSTISRSITQLESRLGIHLCDRGRQGFSLTPEGFEVYRSALNVLASFRRLEDKIESIKGVSEGKLRVAMIDNILSDPGCPLTAVLKRFSHSDPKRSDLQIDLMVLSPEQMEQQLLERRIDIAVGIFESHKPDLHYQFLYQELDYLYCAADSNLPQLDDEREIRRGLLNQRFVTRKFLDDSELRLLGIQVREDFVHTDNIEAVTQLILAGLCVGFIPKHYASPLVKQGLLRPILQHRVFRRSNMDAACLAESLAQRPAIAYFLECLEEHTTLTEHRSPANVQTSQA